MQNNELKIELSPLQTNEEEIFISENQIAFDKAAIEEFGPQEKSVISKETIKNCIHGKFAQAFRILSNNTPVGGVIVDIHNDTQLGELNLLYINPQYHTKGIGQKVWKMIEEKYPNIKVWQTFTPYFEKRNIHFYVNKCGFHIVEFYNPHHPDPNGPCDTPGGEYFFRFEKVMK
jgi:N-acetylglutamate synthase-like GNAT family acetyltransferase